MFCFSYEVEGGAPKHGWASGNALRDECFDAYHIYEPCDLPAVAPLLKADYRAQEVQMGHRDVIPTARPISDGVARNSITHTFLTVCL